jgi:hypothetical protein
MNWKIKLLLFLVSILCSGIGQLCLNITDLDLRQNIGAIFLMFQGILIYYIIK